MKINSKKLEKPRFRQFLIGAFFLCFGNLLFGQEKINLYASAGIPEIINLGVRYQLEQAQIGVGFFVFPDKEGTDYSISTDFLFHFGGNSKLSNRRPWYFKTGLNFIHSESDYSIETWSFLNTRIGRDFNISKKVGISIDLGLAFRLTYKEEVKKQQGWDLVDIEDSQIWPSLGFTVFYRL